MKQATLDLDLSAKKTRKQVFLDQMEKVVPWAALVELIAPYYPEGKRAPPLAMRVTKALKNALMPTQTLPGMSPCVPANAKH